MDDLEKSFLDALRAVPADDETRAVYADWLEEHGHASRADYIRLELRIAALAPESAMAGELQRRVDRLRRVLPSEWVATVARPKPPPPSPPPPRIRVADWPAPPRPPPRSTPVPPPPPERASDAAQPPIPKDSIFSQLAGIERARPRERRCRSCQGEIGRWTSKCPHCGTRQLGFVTGVALVVVLVLAGIALVDEIRWQAKDDNFIVGRKRGCARP